MLVARLDGGAQCLRGALDDLLETADALEQVLIQRKVFLLFVVFDLVLFERADSRENEQLVLAAIAIFAIVCVISTAGLTEHLGCRLKHGRPVDHSP